MTSEGGGGMVSARDFVYASKKGYNGKVFVMGGKSVEYAVSSLTSQHRLY